MVPPESRRDVTGRKQAPERQALAIEVLQQLNRQEGQRDVIRAILLRVKAASGLEAVGLRLREGDDFPYFVTNGFSEDFVEAERHLCARDAEGIVVRDAQGNPVLECMCGDVLQGRTDPRLPFFTQGGSFWTNSTTDLPASTTEADRPARTRNRCSGEGYESVALIPLRSGGETIGLLQLNDRRRGCFTLESIEFFEGIGASIGIALARAQAAETLRALSARNEALLAAMPSIVMETDTNKVYTWANPAGLAFFGEDCIGKEAAYYLVGERDTYQSVQQLLEGSEEVIQVESWQRRCDGGARLLAWWCRSLKDSAGNVTGALSVARDVTDQGRAVEALAESEAKFRALFESTPDAVMVSAEHRFLDCNDAALRVFGCATRDELLGKHPSELSPPTQPDGRDSRKTSAEWVATAMREGSAHFQWLHQRMDGSVFPADVMLSRVDLGSRTVLQGSVRDITEARQAQEALRASEARLRILLDSLPQKVFHKDRDSVYVYANRRYADDLGVTPEDIVGKTDEEFHPAELAEKYRRDDKRVMDSGEVEEFDEAYVQDGQERTVHTVKVPVRDEQGNVHGILGIFRDVTEQRQLERQVLQTSRLETIGTLAGGVAHDFNNILTGVIGYADILRTEGRVSDEGAEELQGIRDLADRAAGLTRQLLAFSRQQRIEPVVVNMNGVVGNLTRMLGRLVGEDVALNFELAPDLHNCRVDAGQIEQVVMNLVVNARQAMPTGGTLTVETANAVLDEAYATHHVGVTPGPYAMMAISDTGCGMDEPTQARVFEPFFTTREVGQGTGLGLATVYGIVKQHGGSVWVYSEPGRGTTFKVYLPAVEVEAEQPVAVAERPAAAGQETILVVEDDGAVLDIAQRALTKQGYTVLAAADPAKAEEISAACEGGISLLLTDVVMPRMAGPELYKRLAAQRPSLRVLYMSGYTTHAALHNGILSAGLPFLQKPFTRDALLRRVREVLDS